MYKYPIGRCPKCGHSILYSHNPKDKNNVIIIVSENESKEKMVLCSKCKTMLNIKNKMPSSIVVPIYQLNN